MKLQIKYNFLDLDQALAIADQTQEHADILEVGQLLLIQHGLAAVRAFAQRFPDKKIYVDAKITDRPDEQVPAIAAAGAHYTSVLAGVYHSIIKKACESAQQHRINIVLDFINASSLGQSAREAKMLGAYAVLVHRENTLDEKNDELENDWQQVRDNTDLPIFIQGKLGNHNLRFILPLRPQVVVVGEAITRVKNPALEAAAIKKLLVLETPPHA